MSRITNFHADVRFRLLRSQKYHLLLAHFLIGLEVAVFVEHS